MKVHVHVVLGVRQVPLDAGDDDPGLVGGVTQDAGVEGEGVGLDGVDELGPVVHAEFLEPPLLGPGPDGDLVDFLVDVDEAGVDHVGFHAGGGLEDLAEPFRGFVDLFDPVEEVDGPGDGVVVAPHLALVVLHLQPTPRSEVVQGPPEQPGPVGHAAAHGPAVDVVEPLAGRVGPVGLDVVDVELDVGGEEGRLDRGKVDPDHDRLRVVVAHLDAPEPRAAAEVEHPLRLDQRRPVQVPAQDHPEDVVEHVQPVLLRLVVGQHVLPFAEGVVPPAIFVAVVEDRTGERRRPRVLQRLRKRRVAVAVVGLSSTMLKKKMKKLPSHLSKRVLSRCGPVVAKC